ncbi:MAG: DUF1553 domain-containing protein, partial [Pirellulaceae bacterium]|nr:DUF1553 domain-containing protein [Pirellulaceae bacterium]
TQWIAQGAPWPDDLHVRERSKADKTWWSLQPLANSPKGVGIDQFIGAKLAQSGLKRNPIADRRTLIRRATYDLTGLPPTPEQVAAFVVDPDPDAYEKLLDRLLQSPHYGERWGRHWLDVVRFGESNGFERNVIIDNLWPFRDYVIASLNDDKPLNQFIREHIAGDVVAPGDRNREIGSAFLVAGPYDNVGNKDAAQVAQIRANTIDEMIRATSEAFLGLTVGCARCHDHKFDPIEQADYYKLYATFAGVRHGSRVVATAEQRADHAEKLAPLNQQKQKLETQRRNISKRISERAKQNAQTHAASWVRDPVDRTRTEETFKPQMARFVRLICEATDKNPKARHGFRIDEFEIWSTARELSAHESVANESTADNSSGNSVNVALASSGSKATGPSRVIEDFPGAYGPQLAIDGKFGARFISTSDRLTIELAEPTKIDRVVFSSARNESSSDQPKFVFVADYRIELSLDAQKWVEVASGRDRKPVSDAHRDHRLRLLVTEDADTKELAKLSAAINEITKQMNAVAPLPTVWVGNHVAADAKGPFHVFVGGSPQRKGAEVTLTSLSTLSDSAPTYELPADADQTQRRKALADWIVSEQNPLTSRVLVNRLWHYHFGTGIVDTPSDFGYMGGEPSHSELLDFLARQLIDGGWRFKPLHKTIMMSQTYRQSGEYRQQAAKVDADSRLLWRFPPRRLSAEEIRDTMLSLSGKLDTTMGGPGFRLYRYLQDNVATYVPLDEHGPETYRRAIYHQNARAARTDLMTDFDQPDCAFSTARRAQTTTPLQALTTLNHQFTLDMAAAMAQRLQSETDDVDRQINRAFQLAYCRAPSLDETAECIELIQEHTLSAFCRILLNTSELIHVR